MEDPALFSTPPLFGGATTMSGTCVSPPLVATSMATLRPAPNSAAAGSPVISAQTFISQGTFSGGVGLGDGGLQASAGNTFALNLGRLSAPNVSMPQMHANMLGNTPLLQFINFPNGIATSPFASSPILAPGQLTATLGNFATAAMPVPVSALSCQLPLALHSQALPLGMDSSMGYYLVSGQPLLRMAPQFSLASLQGITPTTTLSAATHVQLKDFLQTSTVEGNNSTASRIEELDDGATLLGSPHRGSPLAGPVDAGIIDVQAIFPQQQQRSISSGPNPSSALTRISSGSQPVNLMHDAGYPMDYTQGALSAGQLSSALNSLDSDQLRALLEHASSQQQQHQPSPALLSQDLLHQQATMLDDRSLSPAASMGTTLHDEHEDTKTGSSAKLGKTATPAEPPNRAAIPSPALESRSSSPKTLSASHPGSPRPKPKAKKPKAAGTAGGNPKNRTSTIPDTPDEPPLVIKKSKGGKAKKSKTKKHVCATCGIAFFSSGVSIHPSLLALLLLSNLFPPFLSLSLFNST